MAAPVPPNLNYLAALQAAVPRQNQPIQPAQGAAQAAALGVAQPAQGVAQAAIQGVAQPAQGNAQAAIQGVA
jgi:hypothetical protein